MTDNILKDINAFKDQELKKNIFPLSRKKKRMIYLLQF